MELTTPDIRTIRQMMKASWEDGDYGQLTPFKKEWDDDFISRLPIHPGTKLLDVACGPGFLCILAAQRGAEVTGLDLASNLIKQARHNAREQGLNIRFDEGDAEALPYEDNSFDIVTSMIGAMFAPQPEKVVSEMLRVCKPGGTIAMSNWTAEGITGEMFGIGPKYVPPPPGVPYPLLWGNEDVVKQRFGNRVKDLRLTRRIWQIKFPFSEAEYVEFFSKYFGPVKHTLDILSSQPEKQEQMKNEMQAFWKKHNRANDGTVLCDAEWLEVVAVKA